MSTLETTLPIWIGIDGGATNSFAAALTESGEILAQSRSGSLNFFGSSLSAARRNLTQLIHDLELKLPLGNRFQRIVIGNAALSLEATQEQKEHLCKGIVPVDHTRLVSDCLTAYQGACLGAPGVLIICGTGSIVLAQNEQGDFFQTGGWGHILGDEGSAYWIAIQCIKAAIAAVEGHGKETGLVEEICRWIGVKELNDIIPKIYHPSFSKDKIAALSEHLAQHLPEGDPVFQEICQRGGAELAKQAIAATKLVNLQMNPIPLYLQGCVVRKNSAVRNSLLQVLQKRFVLSLQKPLLPPLLGAAVLALAESDIPATEAVVQRLQATYQADH